MRLKRDKIMLVDMDGTVADYDGQLRRDLQAMHEGPSLRNEDLHAMEDAHPHMRARMDAIKHMPGWWRRLPRIESGFEVVRLAQAIGFDIHVLTKGPGRHTAAWTEKVDWCRDQPELAEADIHIVTSKANTYGTVLFDDFPPYMEAWLANRPRGLGVMPVRAYNTGWSHVNVVSYTGFNLAAVEVLLRTAYERGPGEPLRMGAP